MEVVVGYDGSKSATEAIRWAAAAADAHGDALRVVRAWQYPATAVLPIPTREPLSPPGEVEATMRAELRSVVDEVVPPGQRVRAEVVRGPAAHALVEASAAPDVRALVVGARGLGGLAEMLLGSVSRACVDHAPAPVVVIPAGYVSGGRVRRVVVGLDGSDDAVAALAWAREAARGFRAPITAVMAHVPDQSELPPSHAADLRRRAEAELEGWCAAGLSGHDDDRLLVVDGDPRSVLLDVIEQEEADLVVVGTRGLGPVSKLLIGSVASALAHHSPVPVAVVRRT